MTVTQKQYSQLSEMGINVWQSRASLNNSTADSTETSSIVKPLTINAKEIVTQSLFLDVLHSIDCEIGDIEIKNDTVDLGLINWQFSDNSTINFDHNILTTPPLNLLALSTQLKRDLWQTLTEKVLS